MPIGYYADKEQHYVADSLTAPFVLEAFRHYDEGPTMSEIAAVRINTDSKTTEAEIST